MRRRVGDFARQTASANLKRTCHLTAGSPRATLAAALNSLGHLVYEFASALVHLRHNLVDVIEEYFATSAEHVTEPPQLGSSCSHRSSQRHECETGEN